MKAILQSSFHLVEAGKIPEETLTSHVYAGTMGFIMRKHFRKQLGRELLKIMGNLNQLDSGGYHRFVIDLLSYVLGIDEGHQKTSELVSLIQDKMSPNLEKTMSSLAEKIFAEGELKGKCEGKLEGKFEIAKKMLFEGTELVFIMRVTQLSLGQIKQLQREMAKSAEVSER